MLTGADMTGALSAQMAALITGLRLEDTTRVLSFGKRAEIEVADVSRAVLEVVTRPGPETSRSPAERPSLIHRLLGSAPRARPATVETAVSSAEELDRHEFRIRVQEGTLRRLQARAEAANAALDEHIAAAALRVAQADKVEIPAGAPASFVRGRDLLAGRIGEMRLSRQVGENTVLSILTARQRDAALIARITEALGEHDAAVSLCR